MSGRTYFYGVLFAYRLSDNYLVLMLFRILPVAWVRFRDAVGIRRGRSWGRRRRLWGRLGQLLRTVYWPHPLSLVLSGMPYHYVIATRRGTYIIVGLTPEFVNRVRNKINRAKRQAEWEAAEAEWEDEEGEWAEEDEAIREEEEVR
jgi:hypothetical protein